MVTAFIAIGSNQNRPIEQCVVAVECLQRIPKTSITNQSPWYRSEAVTLGDDQEDYINGVVRIETGLEAPALLEQLQGIELQMGRPKLHDKWSPRCIDLDILSYGSTTLRSPQLQLPHPEISKRLFVLLPLRDIAPAWTDPEKGTSIEDLIRTCQTENALQIVKL